tara:strand:+ start:143 stop:334 length:192 start_codon:yes stop_codon:yes gene_type:complete
MYEVMRIVLGYLILGIVFEVVMGKLVTVMEIDRLTNGERIGTVLLWPMYLVIFLVMFINGLRK